MLEQFRMFPRESFGNRAGKPNTFHCLCLVQPEKNEKTKRL